jgi:anti-sigma regulatory factor (Ser/Thr protein kinase)
MSGNKDAPAGRASGGVSRAAFLAALSTIQPGVCAPDHFAGPERGQRAARSGWRFSSHLELGALYTAPGSARWHTIHVLREWDFAELGETAVVLVSELTTNALQAMWALRQQNPSPVRLWLLADWDRVVIVVWDANPLPPVPKDLKPDDESGRGLLLVNTMSSRWGWYETQDPGGKCVWCELVRH